MGKKLVPDSDAQIALVLHLRSQCLSVDNIKAATKLSGTLIGRILAEWPDYIESMESLNAELHKRDHTIDYHALYATEPYSKKRGKHNPRCKDMVK